MCQGGPKPFGPMLGKNSSSSPSRCLIYLLFKVGCTQFSMLPLLMFKYVNVKMSVVNQQNSTPKSSKEGTTPPTIVIRRQGETILHRLPIINVNRTTYKDGGTNIYRVKSEQLLERIGGPKKSQAVLMVVAGKRKACPLK